MVVAAVMAAVMVVLRAVVLSLSPRVDIHLAFGRSGNPPCAAAPQTALPFSRSNRLTSVFELSSSQQCKPLFAPANEQRRPAAPPVLVNAPLADTAVRCRHCSLFEGGRKAVLGKNGHRGGGVSRQRI